MPPPRRVARRALLLIVACAVLAMGARRPEGEGGCGGGQPTPREIEWTDVLRSTTITPLEKTRSSGWRPEQVDAYAGTLTSPSGWDFSNHAGVLGLRWWGDEDSVLVVLSNYGGFERGWVNDDYERPQEYWTPTNFAPFASATSRFPESIYEVRSVDIGECSSAVKWFDAEEPTKALAQMIDQGIATAIRDEGSADTHVDPNLDGRPGRFEVRLHQQPAEAGFDFPVTGLFPNDDFCFEGNYKVSRLGGNGRCIQGTLRLHFCGRLSVDSRWEDFDTSLLPVGDTTTATRVQVGDFRFDFTQGVSVHTGTSPSDACVFDGLPSEESLSQKFTDKLPVALVAAMVDQTWQDSQPDGVTTDMCDYLPRHADWTNAEARAHCAAALRTVPSHVRCGDDVSEGNRGDCEWRVESDRIELLPSHMVIVLAECSSPERRGRSRDDPSSSCGSPDPQGFFLRAGGVCARSRASQDANAVALVNDLVPGARAH